MSLRQGGLKSALRQIADELLRSVKRAARFAISRCHQDLECLAKHFGIDGGLGPIRRVLPPGEAISREEVAISFAESVVGKSPGATALLQAGTREQSAVEVWNSSEFARSFG